MQVVTAEEKTDAPVLDAIERGFQRLLGSGNQRLWCGHCGAMLLEGVNPHRVAHLVFRRSCGAHIGAVLVPISDEGRPPWCRSILGLPRPSRVRPA